MGGDQRAILKQRRRNQHAVERVSMVQRQAEKPVCVTRSVWDEGEPKIPTSSANHLGSNVKLPDRALDCQFGNGNRTQQKIVIRIRDNPTTLNE